MIRQESSNDRYIQIALIAALSYWTFELVRPFIGLLLWGSILAVALYPAYLWLNKRLKGHSNLAAAVLTLVSLVTVIGILSVLTNNTVSSLSEFIREVRAGEQILPLPPASVANWPLIGEPLSRVWTLASTNLSQTLRDYSSYLINGGSVLLTVFANKSLDFIVFILAVFFSGYLLVHGKEFVKGATLFVERVAPHRGDEVMSIIKQTIQRVSIGVIGIAVFQSLAFGLCLYIAGVPAIGILTFAALILSIAQIGLIILIIPVSIWLFITYSTPWAITYIILISLAGLVDNVIKPFVLSHGLRTPIIVIFLGVLGGLMWHGLIGIFIGPVILAVSYALFKHWLTGK